MSQHFREPQNLAVSPTGERLNEFNTLVHRIYGAVVEPDHWPQVVAEVGQSLGADKALLFTPFASPMDGGMVYPWQIEEWHLKLWASKYLDHDLWAQAVVQKGMMHDGSVYTDQDLISPQEFADSVFYVEFLNQIDIGRMCGGIISAGGPGLPATSLSVFRSINAPAFGPNERHWLTLVLPHLSRALGLTQRLSFKRHRLQSLRVALDKLSIGVVLLNEALEVVFSNSGAKEVFERDDGVYLLEGKLLSRLASPASGKKLHTWLSVLSASEPSQLALIGDTFDVPRTSPNARYTVQCCPLEFEGTLRGTEDAQYVVFITDPDSVVWPEPVVLQRKLGLTVAESRVALLLAQGATYRGLADQLYISEETARSHVKNIYTKTRVNQKAMLTQLVLSLATAVV